MNTISLPASMRAQTEVQIVVDDLVRFLKSTKRLIDATPHQHAGAGHCDDVRWVKARPK